MQSPCLKICTLDRTLGICTACRRTLAEIAGWGGMTDTERERIMADLPYRRS